MHICSLRRGQLEHKSSRLACATLQNPVRKKKRVRESKPGRKKERKQAVMMAQRVKQALSTKSDNPGTYMLTEENGLLHATYRHAHACTQTHTHTDTSYTHAHSHTCTERHTKRYITNK